MSKVRVHDSADINWVTLRSLYPANMAAEMSDAEMDSVMTSHEVGGDGSLHLSEFKYMPNAAFDLHAHDKAEIMYVVGGSMVLGTRTLGPGSSVFMEENTLYGFSAGAQGLRILIFRADGRFKSFSKEQYLSARAETA